MAAYAGRCTRFDLEDPDDPARLGAPMYLVGEKIWAGMTLEIADADDDPSELAKNPAN